MHLEQKSYLKFLPGVVMDIIEKQKELIYFFIDKMRKEDIKIADAYTTALALCLCIMETMVNICEDNQVEDVEIFFMGCLQDLILKSHEEANGLATPRYKLKRI